MNNISDLLENNRCEINEICETLKFLDDRKNFLNKQIKEHEEKRSDKIRISEHAIVQYFHRVLGYNIEEIKQELLKDNLQERYKTLGDNTFDQGNFRVRVINNTLVTTLEPKNQKK